MDSTALLVFFGGVLVVAGLVGGGLEIKEARIPKLNGLARVLCVLVGIGLIATSAYLDYGPALGEPDGEPGASTRDLSYEIESYDTGETRYRVCYVAQSDPDGGLNVREAPGVADRGIVHNVVGTIPFDGRAVKYLGRRALVGNVYWYYVRHEAVVGDREQRVVGWTSSYFLCPDRGDCSCRE